MVAFSGSDSRPLGVGLLLGGAFAAGVVPHSAKEYLNGGLVGMKSAYNNSLRSGGHLAAAVIIMATVSSAMKYVRQKEDKMNWVVAGATAFGALDIRNGLSVASKSGLRGGVGAYLCLLLKEKLQR